MRSLRKRVRDWWERLRTPKPPPIEWTRQYADEPGTLWVFHRREAQAMRMDDAVILQVHEYLEKHPRVGWFRISKNLGWGYEYIMVPPHAIPYLRVLMKALAEEVRARGRANGLWTDEQICKELERRHAHRALD